MSGTPIIIPRLLAAPEAAFYLGVSPSTLRTLRLPRRVLRGKRLYDRLDLDAFASDLLYEFEEESPCDEADQVFS